MLRGDASNSDNFKNTIENITDKEWATNKVDKLMRQMHIRIEEKFKDYRKAFRTFDKDYSGGLQFNEFILGMEEMGMRLRI